MTITHDTFRRAEATLLAASIPGADALISVIALALETMAPPPHPDNAGMPEPIAISVAELAGRLGWAPETIGTSLVHASEEMRDHLGFSLFSHEAAEGEESVYTRNSTPARVRLAGQLTSILHGRALRSVAHDDPQALTLDTRSTAMLDLVACCCETGGAVLLREAEVADDREAELRSIAATIADHPRIMGEVVVAGPSGRVEDRVSPAGAILCAVLHGAGTLVLTDVLFDPPIQGVEDDSFDDFEQASRRKVHTWQPTASGERALRLLPHVPIAVLVPVPRDVVLSPRTASAFVTAIGPLRRDRGAAVATMQRLAGGRLRDAVAERLVDIWDGHSDLARTSLGAVDRMIEGPSPRASWRRRKRRPRTGHEARTSRDEREKEDRLLKGLREGKEWIAPVNGRPGTMKIETMQGAEVERGTESSERSHPTNRSLSAVETAALVVSLEATGDFRVLRRLVPLPLLRGQSRSGLRCAIVLDTETTGLILPVSSPPRPVASDQPGDSREMSGDPTSRDLRPSGSIAPPSELISLGMVAVAYDPADGEIKGAIGRFHKLREPSHPIPEAATRIHGITNEHVRGCTITATEIAEWIVMTTSAVQDGVEFGSRDEERLPLIVAHNAAFDRPMVEALFPEPFRDLPWACSLTQVPWAEHGFEGTKLSYLITHAGLFYGARHSALADADAVVELLRQKLDGRTAMAILRETARKETHRVYMTTRYDPGTIADLKARGYRWSNGEGDRPRAWFWEGSEGLDAEMAHLKAAGHEQIEVVRLDAFDRFGRRR